jgi:rSAM/selenodomain-associated transferase 1
MKKRLLIVFVKNKILGQVKTRLAKSIGDNAALIVYQELLAITKDETSKVNADKAVYYSDDIDTDTWENFDQQIQFGVDLGAKMRQAFMEGFEKDYQSIVLIGSDLPDISSEIIQKAFDALEKSHIVFGPAADGGYYLIGLNQMYEKIFKNKPWSQPQLLKITTAELKKNLIPFSLLETLNDIDNYEDLITSNFYKNNLELQEKIKKFHE